MAKTIVGIIEKIKLQGAKTISTYALFDTGARQTSVDTLLASKANLGPVVRTTRIRNPSLHQHVRRPVVMAIIDIAGKKFECEVNIQDRSHMAFPVLIGRNILTGNFVVDTEKNRHLLKKAKRGATEDGLEKFLI